MSEDKIEYDDVAKIADSLVASGRRVTLEYLRRELGRGTHSQIAVMLGRWQRKQKNNNSSRRDGGSSKGLRRPIGVQKGDVAKKSFKDRSKQHFCNQGHDAASIKRCVPIQPFTVERLVQESESVRRIFWSLYIIKQRRAKVLEGHQDNHADSLSLRMDGDHQIREMKRKSTKDLMVIISEISRIKAASERDICAIRNEL